VTGRRVIDPELRGCNHCSQPAPLVQTRDGLIRCCDRCWFKWWDWAHSPCGVPGCRSCAALYPLPFLQGRDPGDEVTA
jgi:hypothetical protein